MVRASVEPRRDVVKTLYRPVLLGATVISAFLCVGFYQLNMRMEKERVITSKAAQAIDVVDIPATAQEQQAAAAPARPAVPVEATDESQVEEMTIMDTELYQQASVAVPDKLQDTGNISQQVEQEAPPMEFWMVEEKPNITTQAIPVYPEIARQAGMEGDVIVEMVIGTDGKVQSVAILRGPPVFHDAAREAAMKMVFTPAKQNDRPVRVKVSQRISFRLRS
jgi:protein TonB